MSNGLWVLFFLITHNPLLITDLKMSACIFCQIVEGKIPSQKVYEDDEIFAFKDITPQAPVHLLIIPKKHFSNLNEVNEESLGLIQKIFKTIQQLAIEFHVAEKGYRVVVNTNTEGGQSVYHLHWHLLGGRQLGPSMVG